MKGRNYFADQHTYPAMPVQERAAWAWEQYFDEAPDEQPEDIVDGASVAVYATDRCIVKARINLIPRRAEFTSSQVVGALIALNLIPVSPVRSRVHFKAGGPKEVTIVTDNGLWEAPVDYVAEEFGHEYADHVAAYLFREYPECWAWKAPF